MNYVRGQTMNSLGAIGSYAVAMQQLQMNIIKQSNEATQQIVELLLDASRSAPVSENKGTQIDINVKNTLNIEINDITKINDKKN